MNKKQLKEYIQDLPDDMEVGVEGASYLVMGLKNAHVEEDLLCLHLA